METRRRGHHLFLPHYRAKKNELIQIEFYRPPDPSPPRPNLMTSPLFVQVVGGIRGLILELEKYFLCEPFRGSDSKVSYETRVPTFEGQLLLIFFLEQQKDVISY